MDGKITKVTFVTKTANYYQQLWAVDTAVVVKLYRKLVSPSIVEADWIGCHRQMNRIIRDDAILARPLTENQSEKAQVSQKR